MAEDTASTRGPAESPIPQAELRAALGGKTVAILGCGGLGSNCAAMLVRTGIMRLTLVDFDEVEEDNLNRQLFFTDQVGMPKVDALASTLARIDSGVELRLIRDCIDAENLAGMVEGADVIVEAVDGAETKALIVNVCSRDMPSTPIVAASGLAGHAGANDIQTVQLGDQLWVAGDLESDVTDGHALVASRVMLAAAHQAHAVIRILLGRQPI